MEWTLFANFAEAAGARRVVVDPDPGATVGDALAALFERAPDLEAVASDGEGGPADHATVLVDGQAVANLDTAVDADADLALLPPVSGG